MATRLGWGSGRSDLNRKRQLFPSLEATPDLRRGEIRFANEALLAALEGKAIPAQFLLRAMIIARTLAEG